MAQPSKGKNTKSPEHLKIPSTASANDFTGLIPANPQQAEDSYEDILPLPNKKGGRP
jgi:hypothetical protein